MIFTVSRASLLAFDDEIPCEGAAKNENDEWTVEIADISALLKFIQKNGDIVLRGPERPRITIYDDYIE
jgi:hypothetical protein